MDNKELKKNMDANLIAPHGGELVNLVIAHERGVELALESSDWPI